jgi:hypothetical protein
MPTGLHRHPVRRLRRQDSELPADHEWLELHRATLPAARRNPERQVAIPGTAAGQLWDQPCPATTSSPGSSFSFWSPARSACSGSPAGCRGISRSRAGIRGRRQSVKRVVPRPGFKTSIIRPWALPIISAFKRDVDITNSGPHVRFLTQGNTGSAAPKSLTSQQFVSICRAVDTWPNRWALCLATDRHARFRPFSKNRSTDDGADPSGPRSYVHEGISLCLTQLCSALTDKRALAPFKRPVATMTSSMPGAGSAP